MFDMGFLEIMVIVVVGLVVIGPERLPGAIKTCAIWINSIRRNLTAARAEFEKQIGADDIRREIHNDEVMASLRAVKDKQAEMRRQINSGNYTGVYKDENTDSTEESIAPPSTGEAGAVASNETPPSDTPPPAVTASTPAPASDTTAPKTSPSDS
ncbi:Sec-independent protein translocase protein TatB [Teredinibacter purpureus]|uniref:Sec-independent protein translocase protein TatB n=1 Tax=Teredinibacter purpureus TaxID=2731756 RepID=UPI000696F0CA|nr:Sec-independent protein translocase protein TatB [Teredinibacter purpureus]